MPPQEALTELAELCEHGFPASLTTGKMYVRKLLMWVPWIGPIRADEILQLAGLNHNRRVNGLNETERWELADVLREFASRERRRKRVLA